MLPYFVQNYSCNYSCRNDFVKTTDFFYSVRMMALQYVVCIREMGRRWEMGFEIYVSLMSDLICESLVTLALLRRAKRLLDRRAESRMSAIGQSINISVFWIMWWREKIYLLLFLLVPLPSEKNPFTKGNIRPSYCISRPAFAVNMWEELKEQFVPSYISEALSLSNHL